MRLLFTKQRVRHERVVFAVSCSNCDYYVALVLDEKDGVYRGTPNEAFLEGLMRMMAMDNCDCTSSDRWERPFR